jgi:disulfide bond formation protein DsbB
MTVIKSATNFLAKYALVIALAQVLAALLGSLYFSNILMFPPCVLCWYQRIAMYPLALTLIVGIILRDRNAPIYVLPPAIIGWFIAAFHCLLYYKIIPDTLAPCSAQVSCTTKFIEYFGFVTIPLLSLAAFTVIIVLMIIRLRSKVVIS